MTLKNAGLVGMMTALVACNGENQTVQKSTGDAVDLTSGLADGAYALISVDVTENGEVTSYLRDQMKIITQNRFMFAFYNELTAKVDAGAGYTEWVDGVLVETPIASQDGPIENLSFDLTVKATEEGFTQSLKGMKYGERSVNMVEQWRTLSTETTIFDGLWKLEKRSSEEDDWAGFSEMKLIGGGHYIFFQSLVVESQPVKHFAFGSFDVNESGEALETGITSSIEGYGGSEYLINMQLTDDNHLTQIFELNGAVITQTYVRI